MRRPIFRVLGALELAVAAVTVYLAWTLPAPREVARGFDRVETTTRSASRQVAAVRRQVVEVRRPEVQQLAQRLQAQTQLVTQSIRGQHVDFDTVVALRDSLREVGAGLDSASDTLDPKRIASLGDGFGETAKFIEDKLLPATDRAAHQFDQLARDLARDAEILAKLLKDAPPDLKAARDVHDSLGRFDEGLERMLKLIELKRLDAIKNGFSGLETALDTTAGEVEKLAGYKYPHVKIRGLKVEIEERPFWPNGDRIAEGLRKATEGVRAAQKELDGVAKEMPAIRQSLDESRKVVAQTRTALGQTLKQQDKLEPLLRDIPTRTAKLAENLPKLAQELVKLLRDTKHLKEVAAGLKQTQSALDTAIAKWPQWRLALKHTAGLLKSSANQLDRIVTHRAEYEASVKQSTELADTFAQMVPLISDQVSSQLSEQEKSLRDLEASLDDVGDTLPEFKRSTVDVLSTGRVLLWLIAVVVGLHGGFLLVEKQRSDVG